jgi:hypothetical protein
MAEKKVGEAKTEDARRKGWRHQDRKKKKGPEKRGSRGSTQRVKKK